MMARHPEQPFSEAQARYVDQRIAEAIALVVGANAASAWQDHAEPTLVQHLSWLSRYALADECRRRGWTVTGEGVPNA